MRKEAAQVTKRKKIKKLYALVKLQEAKDLCIKENCELVFKENKGTNDGSS